MPIAHRMRSTRTSSSSASPPGCSACIRRRCASTSGSGWSSRAARSAACGSTRATSSSGSASSSGSSTRRHQPGRRAAAAVDCRSRAADPAADARRAAVGAGRAAALAQELDELTPDARLRLGRRGLQGLLRDARRGEDGHREGDQAGVPEAGAQAPPGRQPGRQGGRGAGSRRSTRPTRCSAIRRSARSTTSSAPTGGCTSRPAPRAARSGGAWNVHGGGAPGGGFRTMTEDEMREMFGDADPFSDFFHTFFGGGDGPARTPRRAATRGAARAASARAATSSTRSSSASRTPTTAPRGACRITHDGQARTVDVRIPAGVGDGSRVRVAGEGERGIGGAPSGDLYLRIRLTPHPAFERKGRDLYTRVPVPLTTAVLGGEAEVATLGGKTLRLKVPPTTQNGQVFRLKGHGMPTVGKPDETGDLYATVDVQLPRDADARAARALRGAAKAGRGRTRQTHTHREHERRQLSRTDVMNLNKYTEKAQEAVARGAAARRASRATRRSSPSTCSSRSSSSATASCPRCSARCRPTRRRSPRGARELLDEDPAGLRRRAARTVAAPEARRPTSRRPKPSG